MVNNNQFISGEWYEEEYRRGWYGLNYIVNQEPVWAQSAKDYYLGLMIAYTGIRPGQKILDLGCGVGQVMSAWIRRGWHPNDVYGIEISETAVRANPYPNVRCGSVDRLPYYDQSFDLVSSLALFEHIDESILDSVISECYRVGRMQAHQMATQSGTDPSHINIKTPAEWTKRFAAGHQGLVVSCPDPILKEAPIVVVYDPEDVPYAIHLSRKRKHESRNDQ